MNAEYVEVSEWPANYPFSLHSALLVEALNIHYTCEAAFTRFSVSIYHGLFPVLGLVPLGSLYYSSTGLSLPIASLPLCSFALFLSLPFLLSSR